jgi:hypothetical protein
MAKRVHWLKDIDLDEISAVDVGANRKRFRYFKSEGGPGMKSVHARRRGKQEEPPPEETPVDETQPESPMMEEGVALYPWEQCVRDMEVAFSKDDGPRVAALLLAKYGEGENGSIKMPSDIDPIEAAKAAIGEAKGLLKESPLLRPEGNAKATTATKSAMLGALSEFFSDLLPRGKKVSGHKSAGAAVADAEDEDQDGVDVGAQILEELQKLNSSISGTKAKAKPKGKTKPKPGKFKVKPKSRSKDADEDESPDEDDDEEPKDKTKSDGDDSDAEDDSDEEEEVKEDADADDEDEGAEKGELAEVAKAIRSVGKSLKDINQRLDLLEEAGPRRRGKSSAIHDEDDDAEPTVHRSFLFPGARMDHKAVEPYVKSVKERAKARERSPKVA